MFKRIIKFLRSKSTLNEKGSVLAVTLVILVVLAASTATITQMTIFQAQATSIKLETVTDEVTAKRLIQQAASDFEDYIDTTGYDFDGWEISTEKTTIQSIYNVTITDKSGELGFENFTTTPDGISKAYRFAYTLDNGIDLVMYVYISTVGSAVEQVSPFDYSLGTNGDLILTGTYLRDTSIFADSIYFNARAPYSLERERNNGDTARMTNGQGATYPDFDNDEQQGVTYYDTEFKYCTTGNTCYNATTTSNNPYDHSTYAPFVFNKTSTNLADIQGSGLETGQISQNVVASDFLGNFDLDETILDFVKNIGPVDDEIIDDSRGIAFLEQIIRDNIATSNTECEWIQVPVYRGNGTIKWYDWEYVCETIITDGAYALLDDWTLEPGYFDYSWDNWGYKFDTSVVYDGDFYVTENMEMLDRDGEAFVVLGDMIFDNSDWIAVDGKYVVLGDLIFQGDTVDVDGSFYVTGQTIMSFDEESGIIENGSSWNDPTDDDYLLSSVDEYGMSILSKDHILVYSMWESHNSSTHELEQRFDIFLYTDESIYIDAVNNFLYMHGVIFANAKNETNSYFPVVDQTGADINGIVINSYLGYVKNKGALVPYDPSLTDAYYHNGFFLDNISNNELLDGFVEIPEFEILTLDSAEHSEFSYE